MGILEYFVSSAVNKYAADFIGKVSSSNFDLGILSGEIKLNDLEIKGEVLHQHVGGLPITLSRIRIASVTIDVPWHSLLRKPVSVVVDGVYIVASPYYSRDEELEKKAKKLKRLALSTDDDMRKILSQVAGLDKKPALFGISVRLLATVLWNAELEVRNVHVVFEEPREFMRPSAGLFSSMSHQQGASRGQEATAPQPYALGVTLWGVRVQTTNEAGEHGFQEHPRGGLLPLMHRRVEVDSFGVYVDTGPTFASLSKLAKEGRTAECDKLLEEGIERRICEDEEKGKHMYLLGPMSLAVDLALNVSRIVQYEEQDKTRPMIGVKLDVGVVPVAVDGAQIQALAAMASYFATHDLWVHRAMKLPKHRPKRGRADINRDWWAYAIEGTLGGSTRYEETMRWRKLSQVDRRNYKQDYLRFWKVHAIERDELEFEDGRRQDKDDVAKAEAMIEKFEELIPYDDIMFSRLIGDIQVKIQVTTGQLRPRTASAAAKGESIDEKLQKIFGFFYSEEDVDEGRQPQAAKPKPRMGAARRNAGGKGWAQNLTEEDRAKIAESLGGTAEIKDLKDDTPKFAAALDLAGFTLQLWSPHNPQAARPRPLRARSVTKIFSNLFHIGEGEGAMGPERDWTEGAEAAAKAAGADKSNGGLRYTKRYAAGSMPLFTFALTGLKGAVNATYAGRAKATLTLKEIRLDDHCLSSRWPLALSTTPPTAPPPEATGGLGKTGAAGAGLEGAASLQPRGAPAPRGAQGGAYTHYGAPTEDSKHGRPPLQHQNNPVWDCFANVQLEADLHETRAPKSKKTFLRTRSAAWLDVGTLTLHVALFESSFIGAILNGFLPDVQRRMDDLALVALEMPKRSEFTIVRKKKRGAPTADAVRASLAAIHRRVFKEVVLEQAVRDIRSDTLEARIHFGGVDVFAYCPPGRMDTNKSGQPLVAMVRVAGLRFNTKAYLAWRPPEDEMTGNKAPLQGDVLTRSPFHHVFLEIADLRILAYQSVPEIPFQEVLESDQAHLMYPLRVGVEALQDVVFPATAARVSVGDVAIAAAPAQATYLIQFGNTAQKLASALPSGAPPPPPPPEAARKGVPPPPRVGSAETAAHEHTESIEGEKAGAPTAVPALMIVEDPEKRPTIMVELYVDAFHVSLAEDADISAEKKEIFVFYIDNLPREWTDPALYQAKAAADTLQTLSRQQQKAGAPPYRRAPPQDAPGSLLTSGSATPASMAGGGGYGTPGAASASSVRSFVFNANAHARMLESRSVAGATEDQFAVKFYMHAETMDVSTGLLAGADCLNANLGEWEPVLERWPVQFSMKQRRGMDPRTNTPLAIELEVELTAGAPREVSVNGQKQTVVQPLAINIDASMIYTLLGAAHKVVSAIPQQQEQPVVSSGSARPGGPTAAEAVGGGRQLRREAPRASRVLPGDGTDDPANHRFKKTPQSMALRRGVSATAIQDLETAARLQSTDLQLQRASSGARSKPAGWSNYFFHNGTGMRVVCTVREQLEGIALRASLRKGEENQALGHSVFDTEAGGTGRRLASAPSGRPQTTRRMLQGSAARNILLEPIPTREVPCHVDAVVGRDTKICFCTVYLPTPDGRQNQPIAELPMDRLGVYALPRTAEGPSGMLVAAVQPHALGLGAKRVSIRSIAVLKNFCDHDLQVLIAPTPTDRETRGVTLGIIPKRADDGLPGELPVPNALVEAQALWVRPHGESSDDILGTCRQARGGGCVYDYAEKPMQILGLLGEAASMLCPDYSRQFFYSVCVQRSSIPFYYLPGRYPPNLQRGNFEPFALNFRPPLVVTNLVLLEPGEQLQYRLILRDPRTNRSDIMFDGVIPRGERYVYDGPAGHVPNLFFAVRIRRDADAKEAGEWSQPVRMSPDQKHAGEMFAFLKAPLQGLPQGQRLQIYIDRKHMKRNEGEFVPDTPAEVILYTGLMVYNKVELPIEVRFKGLAGEDIKIPVGGRLIGPLCAHDAKDSLEDDLPFVKLGIDESVGPFDFSKSFNLATIPDEVPVLEKPTFGTNIKKYAPGSEAPPRRARTFLLSVEKSYAQGRFRRTTIVTVSNRLQILNRSARHIEIRQDCRTLRDYGAAVELFKCGPQSRCPFWWSSDHLDRRIQMREVMPDGTKGLWTGTIAQDHLGTQAMVLRRPDGRRSCFINIAVELVGGIMFIFLDEEKAKSAHYRIKNYTRYHVSYIQTGMLKGNFADEKRAEIVPKGRQATYAWDWPDAQKDNLRVQVVLCEKDGRPLPDAPRGSYAIDKLGQRHTLSHALNLEVVIEPDGVSRALKIMGPEYMSKRTDFVRANPNLGGPRKTSVMSLPSVLFSSAGAGAGQEENDAAAAYARDKLAALQASVDLANVVNVRVAVLIPQVAVSLVDDRPKELFLLTVSNVRLDMDHRDLCTAVKATVGEFQMDNQTANRVIFPVMISRFRERSVRILRGEEEPMLKLDVQQQSKFPGVLSFKHVKFTLAPLEIQLEEDFMYQLAKFLINVVNNLLEDVDSGTGPLGFLMNMGEPAETDPAAAPPDAATETIHLEELRVAKAQIVISYLGGAAAKNRWKDLLGSAGIPFPGFETLAATVLNLNKAPIATGRIEMDDVFEGQALLVRQIVRSFLSQIGSAIRGVLGSLQILGNVGAAADNISTGFKDFFYEPGRALGSGQYEPGDFSGTLAAGTRSLFANVTGAAFTIPSNIALSIAKGVSFNAGQRRSAYIRKRHMLLNERPKSIFQGFKRGGMLFTMEMKEAARDVVEAPSRNAKKGAGGRVKGFSKALLGLVVAPFSGAAGAMGKAGEGLATMGYGKEAGRKRKPRAMGRALELVPFNRAESDRAELLEQSVGWEEYRQPNELVLFHIEALRSRSPDVSKYGVLITNRCLIYMKNSKPSKGWVVYLEKIVRFEPGSYDGEKGVVVYVRDDHEHPAPYVIPAPLADNAAAMCSAIAQAMAWPRWYPSCWFTEIFADDLPD